MNRIGAASIVLAAAFVGCARKDPPPARLAESAPVKVKTVAVQPRPFLASVAVTGTLVSRSQVDVKAETTGRVARYPKEEGARVAAGEPIAWVDEENYRLAVKQAEAAVGLAQATLDRARVVEAHSRSELERAQRLLESGGITDKAYKDAQLAVKDAAAQTAVALAQLEQAKAAWSVAQKRYKDTVILAPVAGEIQRKHINTGAYVEPPTTVATIVDNSRLELESQVAADDLAPIRAGQIVDFTVSTHPGVKFEGRVVELSPAVDPETRSAKVRIAVNNASGRLKAGMFAQGEIRTGVAMQAIVIPVSSVYRDDRSAASSHVLVVEDGKAARREVKLGRERGSEVEIAAGLKAGDLLIVQRTIEVTEGVRVSPQS
jgi:RND family efflux transporter MFP subunit